MGGNGGIRQDAANRKFWLASPVIRKLRAWPLASATGQLFALLDLNNTSAEGIVKDYPGTDI